MRDCSIPQGYRRNSLPRNNPLLLLHLKCKHSNGRRHLLNNTRHLLVNSILHHLQALLRNSTINSTPPRAPHTPHHLSRHMDIARNRLLRPDNTNNGPLRRDSINILASSSLHHRRPSNRIPIGTSSNNPSSSRTLPLLDSLMVDMVGNLYLSSWKC